MDQGSISYYKGRGTLLEGRKKGNVLETIQCGVFLNALTMIKKT